LGRPRCALAPGLTSTPRLCSHHHHHRRYLEPSKALSDAAGRTWYQVRTRQYEFDRRQQKAAAVAAVSLEQLLRFYDERLAPGGVAERLLCVAVQGGSEEAEGGGGGGGAVLLRDGDVAGFRQAALCYPPQRGRAVPAGQGAQ
jgi:hypothetical protein